MKDKALQELRKEFKRALQANNSSVALKYKQRYNILREFCLNTDILTFQEIETMETEQDDLLNL